MQLKEKLIQVIGIIVPRVKYNYKQALLDLGITRKKDIEYYLTSLKSTDCIGISHDHDLKRDDNDDIYEFITYVNNIKTYIKLTINNKGLLCISFHKSDR